MVCLLARTHAALTPPLPFLPAKKKNSYEDLTRFVRTVSDAGVRHLVVHARKCLLKGLTPTQNRTVPPLKYPVRARVD